MDLSLSSISSSPSIPSPSSFQDIQLRDCIDCRTSDWTRLPTGELQLNLVLCSLHEASLLAPPTRRRAKPTPNLSPSPEGAEPAVLHRATRALIPSRRGGATPPSPDNHRIARPLGNATPHRPRSTTPPPSRRRRLDSDSNDGPRYGRSSVAGEALDTYRTVLIGFSSRPDTTVSLSKFLKQKNIPQRSFYRKKKIAELAILDPDRFDNLIRQILREEKTKKINQQILSDRCGTILKQNDYREKIRLAIASGKIL